MLNKPYRWYLLVGVIGGVVLAVVKVWMVGVDSRVLSERYNAKMVAVRSCHMLLAFDETKADTSRTLRERPYSSSPGKCVWLLNTDTMPIVAGRRVDD